MERRFSGELCKDVKRPGTFSEARQLRFPSKEHSLGTRLTEVHK